MQSLGMTDAVGFIAAALTLATFSQTSMTAMRLTAIAANLCFISYGVLGGFLPIALLHTLLLPINITRLRQLRRPVAAPAPEPNQRSSAAGVESAPPSHLQMVGR